MRIQQKAPAHGTESHGCRTRDFTPPLPSPTPPPVLRRLLGRSSGWFRMKQGPRVVSPLTLPGAMYRLFYEF